MSIIKIFDRINETTVSSFQNAYDNLKNYDKEFRLRINSNGGNYGSFGKISPILLKIAQQKIHLIGEAVYIDSAATLLFLNFSLRIVETSSKGGIHLPEPNTDGISEEIAEKTKNEAINFIRRRTHLSKSTIVSLNKVTLSANDMIKLHIANKKVRSFDEAGQ